MLNMLKSSALARRNERGSLPVVMGVGLLVSAVAVMLSAFAFSSMRNAEITDAKNNLNSSIEACTAILAPVVQQSHHAANIPDLAPIAAESCVNPVAGTTVVVSNTPVKYKPVGATQAQGVQVELKASVVGGGGKAVTTKSTRIMRYAEVRTQELTANSYISRFDDSGKAVWVVRP